MSIYHLSIKTVSRAHGRSAVAAAAYRAAVTLWDARLGQNFDFRRKSGVIHTEILAPVSSPYWARDRNKLWNEAESSELRKNSTSAREFEVALPAELSQSARLQLAQKFARELVAMYNICVDLCVHAPGKGGDSRNHHAHILCTTRSIDLLGFGRKTRELDDQKSGAVLRWRERWSELVNAALHEEEIDARVDHRSLADQGVDRAPSVHMGPARTAIARRCARVPNKAQAPTKSFALSQTQRQLQTMRDRLKRLDTSRFANHIEEPQTFEKGDHENAPNF